MYIIYIILGLLLFILLYKSNTIEHMISNYNLASDDVEAIRNLSSLANNLTVNKKLTTSKNLEIKTNIVMDNTRKICIGDQCLDINDLIKLIKYSKSYIIDATTINTNNICIGTHCLNIDDFKKLAKYSKLNIIDATDITANKISIYRGNNPIVKIDGNSINLDAEYYPINFGNIRMIGVGDNRIEIQHNKNNYASPIVNLQSADYQQVGLWITQGDRQTFYKA